MIGSRFDNVIGFVDGTLNGVARPVRGQEAVYNGHVVRNIKKFIDL